jgi:hypothetical protein
MTKRNKEATNTYSPENIVRNMLIEAGFPLNQQFSVVSKDGRLTVRLGDKHYERIQFTR